MRRINLKTCAFISDVAIEELSKSCPLLEEIDLSWCDISEKSLLFLSKNTKELTAVSVRSCYITDKSVTELLKNCKKIETLSLAWCKSLTDVALKSIVIYGENIKDLDLRGNNHLSSVHLKRCLGVTHNVIIALSKSARCLEKLNLRGCYKNNNISNADLISLFSFCPNLTSIDLAWHSYLDDISLTVLANNCKKLESIDISGCSLISSEALCQLSDQCSKLKIIVLFKNKKISEATIASLRKKGIKIKAY